MARAVALARFYARPADLARIVIVLGCGSALMLAERAFPLF